MNVFIRLLLGFFFVIGLNCTPADAQDTTTGRVEGRVLSAGTEVPVSDATVEILGDDRPRGTTTAADGRFVVEALPPGPTRLEIRHVGHVPAVRTVRVRDGEATRVTVELERDVVELSGLEITSRSEAAQASFPGATFTVDAAELERSNPIGLQETLLSVPGVFGRADDGMGQTRMSISIRGLQSRRTQRVLVMEDGVPIQPAPYIFSPLYYNPPVERIEKTEIIKGSSSIRHGPQTMAGVINFVTGRPQRRSPGGELKITGGSHRYASAFAEVGGFGTDALRPQVQLLMKRGGGFRDNNDFLQLNGTAKLQYDLSDDQSLYLKGNVDYEDMNATYHGLTPHSFETNPDFNPKDDDSYRILRGAFDAIYNHNYGGSLRSTTKLYANVFDRPWWREENVFVRADDYEENGAAAEPVPPTTPGDLVRVAVTDVTDRDRAVAFGNERTFHVTGLEHTFDIDHGLFGRSASLETGLRLHYERFEDANKIGDDPEARDGVFFRGDRSDPPVTIVGKSRIYETQALALYGLEELQLGPLRLSPGVRLELFNQSSTDRLDGNRTVEETNVVALPGLGFNWDLGRYALGAPLGDGQFNLFGGVHRGYTSPSSATFLTLGVNDPNREAAFDLQAEKSWNSELGLRGRTGAGQFQFTGFYTYVEDLVGGKTRFTQNLGVVQSYGLETNATLEGDAFASVLPTLDASYTFMQTEVVEGIVPSAVDGTPTNISGNELIAAPPHTATVGLTKTFSRLGLTLRSSLRYRGGFYTDLENLDRTSNRGEVGPVPSHTVLDAGATYRYSSDLRLNLTVKNATDNVYIGSRLHSNPRDKGPSSNGGSTGILPGPRRQINLSVQYDF
ncbi:MAG: TonB-dependent receptor [Salinibacter sp.]|uniref:TonB-dependent receptor domain-containing protein n=1 Tax=Salinibacter sp. TaxID=2065818 RepID=UPI002FC32522